jgi:hypothetical protein
MSTDWDSLFDISFDRARAVALHDEYRENPSEYTLESCFSAFVPLVGTVFRRKSIRRQDFDDAFSAISPRLWSTLKSPNVNDIIRYLNFYLNRSALNFMRTHPLYSKRLNPPSDGRPFPKRQMSVPDVAYLEELVKRAPEVIAAEAEKHVRHGGVYRTVVVEAIQCFSKRADPSPVKLGEKHGIPDFTAGHLCQVACFLVRKACSLLRSEVTSFSYRELVT